MFKWLHLKPKASYPSDTEDYESLIPENAKGEAVPAKEDRRIRQLLTIVLLMIAFPLTALIGAYLGGRYAESRDGRFCVGQISNYSPLLEDVDIKFDTVQFNGSLFKKNEYRQQGGPEVDAAWEALGVDYRAAIVPTELAARSGLLESQVQVREEYGGGYPANVEGLHHLHCLNLLRQSLYYNFEYYHALKKGAFMNSDEVLHSHVSHCLDILRQQLMCTVDIAVLGQVWWNRKEPTAYPDFNTKHKCRNFDAVRQWAFEHQAPLEVPDDYLEPPRIEDVYESVP